MAYVGSNDRVQDYIIAQHAQASRDTSTYLLGNTTRTLPSGETQRTAILGPATALLPQVVRPESMTSAVSSNDKTVREPGLPPKPQKTNSENLVRFFDLWNIDKNLASESCAYLRLYRELLQSEESALPADGSEWRSEPNHTLSQPLHNNVHRFIQRFASTTKGKSLLVTDSGYLGLGLNATRVGDYVCIIRGCSLPVVIRKDADGDYFEVVCQCYTWGTMYGEFVDSMEARELEWETIMSR